MRFVAVVSNMPRNLALVGCGAIARAFYLPALAALRDQFGQIWLVDPGEHAQSIDVKTLGARLVPRLSDVDGEIDMAIVATPNHLHVPLALEALARGAHVLVEKPFALCPAEGRTLIEAAAAAARVVAVNQTRRLSPVSRALRRVVEQGEFGSLKSVVHHEGTRLTWPFESGAAFAKTATRTGAIMDFGVHVIDFYQYVLSPSWRFKSAIHDGFAGPEGLAEIELAAGDAEVSIRLSRYYPQENVARLVFDRAEVCVDVYEPRGFSVRSESGRVTEVSAECPATEPQSPAERLLLNFVAAIDGREPAVCDAASSLPVIAILDQIYKFAARYPSGHGLS
jgi:predicted dehydrogenase